jgi:hypothetical protein
MAGITFLARDLRASRQHEIFLHGSRRLARAGAPPRDETRHEKQTGRQAKNSPNHLDRESAKLTAVMRRKGRENARRKGLVRGLADRQDPAGGGLKGEDVYAFRPAFSIEKERLQRSLAQ